MSILPDPSELSFEPFKNPRSKTKATQEVIPNSLNLVLRSGSFIKSSRKDIFVVPFTFIAITLFATQLSPSNLEMIILISIIFGYLAIRSLMLKFISVPMIRKYEDFSRLNSLPFRPVVEASELPHLINIPPLDRDSRIYPYQVFEFPSSSGEAIRVYNVQSENRFLTSGGFGTKIRNTGIMDLPTAARTKMSTILDTPVLP